MRRLLWDAFSRVNKRLVPWETIYMEYGIKHPTDAEETASVLIFIHGLV